MLSSIRAFFGGKMSGSAQKDPAYNDESTGDEYDKGRRDFWREFRPHFGRDASPLLGLLVTQPQPAAHGVLRRAWPAVTKPACD